MIQLLMTNIFEDFFKVLTYKFLSKVFEWKYFQMNLKF